MSVKALRAWSSIALVWIGSAAAHAATKPAGQVHDEADYDPGACDATFPDVDVDSPLCPWIEQLVADGISEGCGDDGNGGTNFCPDQPVTRGQLARLLERAMRGTTAWDVNADLLDGHDASEFVTAASQTWASTHRRYYLTTAAFNGADALGACSSGYHMASLWEIHDVSTLVYDTSVGLTAADSGSGPPTTAYGWARTGSAAGGFQAPGGANCQAWTTADLSQYGTVIRLVSDWNIYGNDDPITEFLPRVPTWLSTFAGCGGSLFVWCVQD